MPCGHKLVGVHNTTGMKSASKFSGTFVVKLQCLNWLRVCKGLQAAAMPPITVVQAACLHSTRFQSSAQSSVAGFGVRAATIYHHYSFINHPFSNATLAFGFHGRDDVSRTT
eukprot:1146466-Pelagomonas_calceolata.AAC.3